MGVALSFDLPIHDRNQGEIARSQVAVRQAVETESSTQVGVLTDVVNAYYGLKSNEEIVTLYESGYLDQATQSRDISNYAYHAGRRRFWMCWTRSAAIARRSSRTGRRWRRI